MLSFNTFAQTVPLEISLSNKKAAIMWAALFEIYCLITYHAGKVLTNTDHHKNCI